MSKSKIKFCIRTGYNPQTKGTIKRPIITDREICTTDMAVERALESGYVRGQFHDIKGVVDGSIACWRQLIKEGKAVHLGNWLRLQLQATGTVDDTCRLTNANKLRLSITPLEDLKVSASDYEWERVDETAAMPRIEYGSSPDGKCNEITKSKAIVFTGRNLTFTPEKDEIKVEWQDGETPKTLSLEPTEISDAYLRFDWPAALDELADGTKLTWSFRLILSDDREVLVKKEVLIRA